MSLPAAPEAASRFIRFVNASPTPFHAVHNAALRLEKAGFVKVKELDHWEKSVSAGGKYYFTRNQSALLAFTLPQNWKPGAGVSIVATHVDSPNLRIRPISKRSSAGFLQVGVETYGGGLWHTWFDRDLSIAGRVFVKENDSDSVVSRLIKVDRPILRIPNLAIHLERGSGDNFKFNTETEMVPVLSMLNKPVRTEATNEPSMKSRHSVKANHHSELISLLASELGVSSSRIHDFELHLYDTQPSALGGLQNEFIQSPRLDNLMSSFCAVEGLVGHVRSNIYPTFEGNVNCIALFNHEEIGSVSTTGAESSLLTSFLERLSPSSMLFSQSIARSFLVSSDMGHSVHPNYTSKHEENHRPLINGGIVIKTNAKQRYASDAVGSYVIRKLAQQYGGDVQEYEARNDMPCGSTVGPMLSKLGIRTVDVGGAMLSMHSIREMAGSHDVQLMINVFGGLFESFAKIDAQIKVD